MQLSLPHPSLSPLARSAAVGTVLGFVVVTLAVAAITIANGMGAASALALGAYVGAFGGVGFGCMVGCVTVLAREDADREDAR